MCTHTYVGACFPCFKIKEKIIKRKTKISHAYATFVIGGILGLLRKRIYFAHSARD